MDLRPYLDELERFADGQLSEAEQEAFEQRLTQDEKLSGAYQAYEQFTADLRWVAGHETLRRRLRTLDKRLDQQQAALVGMQARARATRIRWGLLAAAIVLVLSVVGWLTWRPINADQAWTRSYVPDSGLTEAAAQRTNNPLLIEAMRQYRDGHYPAALHSLRRIPASTLGADTLLYYTGVLLLRQNEAGAARSYLTRATQQPTSALAGKARYHLAMAQLRTGQRTQAHAALQAVAQDAQNPCWAEARAALRASELFAGK